MKMTKQKTLSLSLLLTLAFLPHTKKPFAATEQFPANGFLNFLTPITLLAFLIHRQNMRAKFQLWRIILLVTALFAKNRLYVKCIGRIQ
jgi:succinate dehydrogenase hydrophobic anchor subunit